MSLITRAQTSWELLQRSLQVLRANPKLLLFPIVSALCTLALALFFFSPILVLIFSRGWTSESWEEAATRLNVVFYAYGALIYLVSMFAATFFNVAFYSEILRALANEPVSVGQGLRFALSRVRSILMWSLLAATVGLIIRAIEERLGWLGKIGMALVGTAWSVAAVFAIPVIIRRGDTNPFAVLRDSAVTLKKTWGESLVGYVGIQLGGVMFVLVTACFTAAFVFGMVILHQPWLAGTAIVFWVLSLIALSVVLGMASHVYRCALYIYASEGVVPSAYTADMMDAGWKIKKA